MPPATKKMEAKASAAMTKNAGILSMNRAARPTKETRTPKAPVKLPNDVSAGGLPTTWCLALVTDSPSTTAAESSCIQPGISIILSSRLATTWVGRAYQQTAHCDGNDGQHVVFLFRQGMCGLVFFNGWIRKLLRVYLQVVVSE